MELDLPPQIFETVGMWLEIPDKVKQAIHEVRLHFMGGLHAMEHGLIAMFPLFALADRYDIGGISTTAHPQVGKAAIFIYDGYPGGIGIAEKAYELFHQLVKTTYELIRDCACEAGCPSCIYSPKCGNNNEPLDKKATLIILSSLLQQINNSKL